MTVQSKESATKLLAEIQKNSEDLKRLFKFIYSDKEAGAIATDNAIAEFDASKNKFLDNYKKLLGFGLNSNFYKSLEAQFSFHAAKKNSKFFSDDFDSIFKRTKKFLALPLMRECCYALKNPSIEETANVNTFFEKRLGEFFNYYALLTDSKTISLDQFYSERDAVYEKYWQNDEDPIPEIEKIYAEAQKNIAKKEKKQFYSTTAGMLLGLGSVASAAYGVYELTDHFHFSGNNWHDFSSGFNIHGAEPNILNELTAILTLAVGVLIIFAIMDWLLSSNLQHTSKVFSPVGPLPIEKSSSFQPGE